MTKQVKNTKQKILPETAITLLDIIEQTYTIRKKLQEEDAVGYKAVDACDALLEGLKEDLSSSIIIDLLDSIGDNSCEY